MDDQLTLIQGYVFFDGDKFLSFFGGTTTNYLEALVKNDPAERREGFYTVPINGYNKMLIIISAFSAKS